MMRGLTLGLLAAIAATLAAGCGIGDAQQRLRTAIDAKRGELNACYADALTRDRDLQGEMSLWLQVESSGGSVEDVEMSGGDLADPALEACVDGVLRTVQMDEPPKKNLRVQYSLTFTPEG